MNNICLENKNLHFMTTTLNELLTPTLPSDIVKLIFNYISSDCAKNDIGITL